MSNYPPGVTGNEPQIVGYPEETKTVSCTSMIDAKRIRVVAAGEIEDVAFEATILDDVPISADVRPGDQKRVRAATFRRFELREDEIECPFSGPVEGTFDGEDFAAECPLCGNEIIVSFPEDDR